MNFISILIKHFVKQLLSDAPSKTGTHACLCVAAIVGLSGCAVLHHVQVGEFDNRAPGRAFEIKVSETGVDLNEARQIQQSLFKDSREANAIGDAAAIIALFQMGPVTGNPVYTSKYAENILRAIREECPSGKITGLMSVRETRKYPVVSGEIVKVNGICLDGRSPAANSTEALPVYAPSSESEVPGSGSFKKENHL